MSQKQKGRALLTLLSSSPPNYQCHTHLQKILPALQRWKSPMHFKIQPLQRRLVTLEQRNFKHCANYQIFFLRHFRLAQPNMHPH
jgi:hypothetical protein